MFALLTKPRGAPPGAKPAWAARHHVGPRDLRVPVEPPVLPQPIKRWAVNRPSPAASGSLRKDRVRKPAALAAFLSEGRQSSVLSVRSTGMHPDDPHLARYGPLDSGPVTARMWGSLEVRRPIWKCYL